MAASTSQGSSAETPASSRSIPTAVSSIPWVCWMPCGDRSARASTPSPTTGSSARHQSRRFRATLRRTAPSGSSDTRCIASWVTAIDSAGTTTTTSAAITGCGLTSWA